MNSPLCDSPIHSDPPACAFRHARMFALPVILVAAGEARLPCQIDAETVLQLMREHGLLAPDALIGLSSALIDSDALDSLASSQSSSPSAPAESAGDDPFGLSPAPVVIKEESAWLRFMVGSVPLQTTMPEAGDTIEKWAMPLSQALGKMLARDGASVLALPRAPQDLTAARTTGRAALLETRLQLFASNAIRAIRSKNRTPVAVIAHHEDHEVRITISSAEDTERWHGFVWPLEAGETCAAVFRFASELFHDCRLADIRVIDALQPDLSDDLPFFITAHIPPRRTL